MDKQITGMTIRRVGKYDSQDIIKKIKLVEVIDMKIATIFMMALLVSAMAVVAESATIIKDVGCGLLDADGNIMFVSDMIAVGTESKNGNAMLNCKGELPDGSTLPDKAVKWDYESTGLMCNTLFGITDQWQAVVTPSGQVSLSCHYKNPEAS
jgi:hypothetical protein